MDITPCRSINREPRSLGTGHLFLYGSSLTGTWKGAPLLGTLKVMKRRLGEWASPFMGAQMGKMEWAHLPWTFKYG